MNEEYTLILNKAAICKYLMRKDKIEFNVY